MEVVNECRDDLEDMLRRRSRRIGQVCAGSIDTYSRVEDKTKWYDSSHRLLKGMKMRRQFCSVCVEI